MSNALLSGDVRLTFGEKVRWMWGNFLAGISGYASGRHTRYWYPKTLENGNESPSRKHIDAFLAAKLPELLPEKNITVLDVGCGTGYIYKILRDLGFTFDYTGLDVQKRAAYDKNVPDGRLILTKIEDFTPDQRYDLVISNTCLEHVEDDVAGAKKALSLGDTQVHIVPTFWSLPLYLFHGYRQYTPKSIKKLFGDAGEVYRLGGVFSFFIMFFLVTIPQRLHAPFFFRKYRWYSSVCRIANSLDRLLPIMSVMYVIMIPKK